MADVVKAHSVNDHHQTSDIKVSKIVQETRKNRKFTSSLKSSSPSQEYFERSTSSSPEFRLEEQGRVSGNSRNTDKKKVQGQSNKDATTVGSESKQNAVPQKHWGGCSSASADPETDIGRRCSNPDPEPIATSTADETRRSFLVAPSVIRISPTLPHVARSGERPRTSAATDTSVQVLRPFAVKTTSPLLQAPGKSSAATLGPTSGRIVVSHGQELAGPEVSRPKAEQLVRKVEESTRAKHESEKKALAKRRQEEQTNFPSRGSPQRMPPASGRGAVMMSQDDGVSQAPTHVQNVGNGGRPYAGRQQPHGRSQQHLRTTSVASSTGGTPSIGRNQLRGMSNGSALGDSDGEVSPSIQPTPLFQRLVSEEVQELKNYARIIESQNNRLAELERVHGDLEARLEQQTKGRMELERTLEDRERSWTEKFAMLEKDRDKLMHTVEHEKQENEKWKKQHATLKQDIQKMFMRKYDNQRDTMSHSTRNLRQGATIADRAGNSPASLQGSKSATSGGSGEHKMEAFKSPREFLADSGTVEELRGRNASHALLDFFGVQGPKFGA